MQHILTRPHLACVLAQNLAPEKSCIRPYPDLRFSVCPFLHRAFGFDVNDNRLMADLVNVVPRLIRRERLQAVVCGLDGVINDALWGAMFCEGGRLDHSRCSARDIH